MKFGMTSVTSAANSHHVLSNVLPVRLEESANVMPTLPVLEAHQDPLAFLELLENPDALVSLEPKVLEALSHLWPWMLLEPAVIAQLDHVDHLELLEPLVPLEVLESLEALVFVEEMVAQDHLDPLVLLVALVAPVALDPLDSLDKMALAEAKEPLDPKDHLDPVDYLDALDLEVVPELLVALEPLDHVDHQDQEDHLVSLELLVALDHRPIPVWMPTTVLAHVALLLQLRFVFRKL